MPTLSRPDGTTIHYEVFGSGYPLLLIAPGGVSSEIAFWGRSVFDPTKELANDFQLNLSDVGAALKFEGIEIRDDEKAPLLTS